ncbi:MAG: hypothetical protein QOF97_1678 [Acidimicrobiaceae bacterium]
MEPADFRARLEAQAADIVGRARAEATEIVRAAEQRAAELEAEGERRVTAAVNDIETLRQRAHRELVLAQEKALIIRSDAQRTADGIVERATLRARTEADELLHEARRHLARAIDEKKDAQARIREAEHAERRAADAVELVAMAAAEAVAEAATVAWEAAESLAGSAAEVDAPAAPEVEAAIDLTLAHTAERDRFVVTMRGETFDDLLAGAVRAAVRRAFNPLVRAGHYTESRVLEPHNKN